ncbi:MAG: flagellar basal body-associated FliL family protein [Opitutaceae bacterium]|nr:flagellar basal body-associated FliL family protein [Opitutaceae bacterium]
MAAKTEAKEGAAPAAPEKEPAAPGGSALKSLLPALAALVLAPATTWGVAEYVLLPRLQQKLAAGPAGAAVASAPAEHAAPAHGGGHGKEKGKEGETAATYEFNNVVVNLSGTMGTRYLKVSFLVTGADANLKGLFDTNKARLTDVTLSVLSSLTLADLEEPGSKNVLREKLVAAYNQAIGRRVAEQVYFSDFVIQ